ncbi:MAG TPA: hypothetical protein VLJ11_04270 [Bryobacteraceae bacterium]|nr:hypothetical protein [Bryobacteraceae bacterium]
MDLHKIIHELQIEKQRLDEAIIALEKLSNGGSHRRGRPSRKPEAPKPQEHPTTSEPSSPQAQAHPHNG